MAVELYSFLSKFLQLSNDGHRVDLKFGSNAKKINVHFIVDIEQKQPFIHPHGHVHPSGQFVPRPPPKPSRIRRRRKREESRRNSEVKPDHD